MATISPKEREDVLDLSNEWTQEGARNMVLHQITYRFGRVPGLLKRRLMRLSERTLHELGEALFKCKSIAGVEAWVNRHLKKTRR